MSNWDDHPGGSVIFTHAGDDCTDVFAAFHPASASRYLEKFEIGDLDETVQLEVDVPQNDNKLKPTEQKAFEKSYRELRAKLFTLGYFNASPAFYAYKVMSNLVLLGLAAACAIFSESLAVHLTGAVLLGLFWQQCGWLAHDFLHHQVFKTRMYGDLMGLLVGNVFQGFSVHWWKMKHNTHHAVPNLLASCPESADGDPDIDTMPILAWTISMAELGKNSDMGRFLIKYQSIFYFPVLLFARLSWAHQSWVFNFGGVGGHSVKQAENDQKRIQYPLLEKAGLILHYIGLFWILSYMPIMNAVAYFFVSQMSCGLFLAFVFGLGHNGMSVYPGMFRLIIIDLYFIPVLNVCTLVFLSPFRSYHY